MNDLPVLNRCVDALMAQLSNKQEDLRRAETSQGTKNDIRKMNKLRQQIASLETSLRRAEKSALSRPDGKVR